MSSAATSDHAATVFPQPGSPSGALSFSSHSPSLCMSITEVSGG